MQAKTLRLLSNLEPLLSLARALWCALSVCLLCVICVPGALRSLSVMPAVIHPTHPPRCQIPTRTGRLWTFRFFCVVSCCFLCCAVCSDEGSAFHRR